MEPGDYGRHMVRLSPGISTEGEPFWAWWVCTPNGLFGRLSMPEDSPHHHYVEEHDDGTVTIVPQEGNTNSILVKGANGVEWHGWIRHGVWESI